MEITDILKPGDSSYSLNRNEISANKNNKKFRELIEKGRLEAKNNEEQNNHKNKKIDKKLMDTCIEMESIFVSKMLKEMRNTIPEEKLIDGGYAEKIFEDMLYDNYSLTLSKTSNLGLATMLYNELSKK